MAKKSTKEQPPKREKTTLTPEKLTYVADQIQGFANRYRTLASLVSDLKPAEIRAGNWKSLILALDDVSVAVGEAYKAYDRQVIANGPFGEQSGDDAG